MKNIFLSILSFGFVFNAFSQVDQPDVGRFKEIDSIRVILYKDSLGLSDATIKQLFSLRNYFYEQSSMIASKNDIDEKVRTDYRKNLRKGYMVSIEKLLGKEKFEKYLLFIQRRLDYSGQTLKPLTIE